MGLLNISEQEAVALESIKSDAAPTTRRSAWTVQLEELREHFFNGTYSEGQYVELARFASAAGARVKAKQLEEKDQLPGYGGFGFKVQTWVGATDGKRHSSLYGTYRLGLSEIMCLNGETAIIEELTEAEMAGDSTE